MARRLQNGGPEVNMRHALTVVLACALTLTRSAGPRWDAGGRLSRPGRCRTPPRPAPRSPWPAGARRRGPGWASRSGGQLARRRPAQRHAQQAAQGRQGQRLDQELGQDVPGLAPTAMRTPISRVRSVTLTSMMFMMPMPPTSSDTRGDPGQQHGQRPGALVLGRGGLGQVADREVVRRRPARCGGGRAAARSPGAGRAAVASAELAPTYSGPGDVGCPGRPGCWPGRS